jgi:hypothetical protein
VIIWLLDIGLCETSNLPVMQSKVGAGQHQQSPLNKIASIADP